MLDDLRARIGLHQSASPFAGVVEQAHTVTWTRDPFDRLIVAAAALHDAALITRDRRIREHFAAAIW